MSLPRSQPRGEGSTADVFHRVQRTGGSSLAVTLPKPWAKSMHVSDGDVVRMRNLGEGRLEITPATPSGARAGEKVLSIRVDHSAPNMICRLLVGAYVTGQDLVRLSTAEAFTTSQLEEINQTVARVLGMNVVEERPNRIEIQVFVDPARHRLPHLRDRVARLLRTKIGLCRRILAGTTPPPSFRELGRLEEETDRIYLLMVRQLLLASDDFRVAQDIGVPSHHHQIGERLVAKILEMMGDRWFDTGRELLGAHPGLRRLPSAAGADLDRLFERFDALLARTMEAFSHLSVEEANATLNELREELDQQSAFSHLQSRRYPDVRTAMLVQRIVSNLSSAWEMLVAVNEVALNRFVEPERIGGVRPERPVILGPGNGSPPTCPRNPGLAILGSRGVETPRTRGERRWARLPPRKRDT